MPPDPIGFGRRGRDPDPFDALALIDVALADTPDAREDRNATAVAFAVHDAMEHFASSPELRRRKDDEDEVAASIRRLESCLSAYAKLAAGHGKEEDDRKQRLKELEVRVEEDYARMMALDAGRMDPSVLWRAKRLQQRRALLRLRLEQATALPVSGTVRSTGRKSEGLALTGQPSAGVLAQLPIADGLPVAPSATVPTVIDAGWTPQQIMPDRRALAGLLAHYLLNNLTEPRFALRIASIQLAVGEHAPHLAAWVARKTAPEPRDGTAIAAQELATVLDWARGLRNPHTRRFDGDLIRKAFSRVMGDTARLSPIAPLEAPRVKQRSRGDSDRER